MEFSWDFRGSESLRPKHFLTLGPFSWVFRGIFVEPTKNEISGIIGEFSWLFRGRPCPASNRKYAQPTP